MFLVIVAMLIQTQSPALTQDATNPLTAWTNGFAPTMEQKAPTIGANSTSDTDCKPVIVVTGSPAEQKAGQSLAPATKCEQKKRPTNVSGQAKPAGDLNGQQTLKENDVP